MTLLTIFLLNSCTSLEAPINRRVISDGAFKEELSITTKTPKALPKRSYHWFKSQDTYASQNDYAGLLLDGAYTKYYYTNELAEKGNFKKGLKSGKWTAWNQNGTISEVSKWKKGIRTASYISRDSSGNTQVYGNYKKGLKDGYWIYPIEGDTLYYFKGQSIIIDSTFKKPTFISKTFGFLKKKKKGANEEARDSERDSTKSSFFKRLFKKKDTLQNEAVEIKTKKLSQKERAELVRAKEGSKAVNLEKKKISQKDKKIDKNRQKRVKKKSEVTKNSENAVRKDKGKAGFFKRLFRKKDVESNQNTLND